MKKNKISRFQGQEYITLGEEKKGVPLCDFFRKGSLIAINLTHATASLFLNFEDVFLFGKMDDNELVATFGKGRAKCVETGETTVIGFSFDSKQEREVEKHADYIVHGQKTSSGGLEFIVHDVKNGGLQLGAYPKESTPFDDVSLEELPSVLTLAFSMKRMHEENPEAAEAFVKKLNANAEKLGAKQEQKKENHERD
jgi:hypothetical protein